MAAGSNRTLKQSAKRRIRPVNLLLLLLLTMLGIGITVDLLSPRQYVISAGSIAKDTITAPRTVEDPLTTEALRESARNAVKPVYALSEETVDTLMDGVNLFFRSLTGLRNAAEELRISTLPLYVDENGEEQPIPPEQDTRSWENVISQDTLLGLLTKLPVNVTDTSLGYALLNASEAELERFRSIVTDTLSDRLSAGIDEQSLDRVKSEAKKNIQITTLPVRIKGLGETLYDSFMQVTITEDIVRTNEAREKAASAVEPVRLPRGTTIVSAGDTVTAAQMEILRSLDLVKGANVNRYLIVGIAVWQIVSYLLLFVSLKLLLPELYASAKGMLMLTLILAVTAVLAWPFYLFDPRIMPTVFAVLLTAILLPRGTAEFVNIALSLSLCILSGGSGKTLLSSESLLSLAAMLVSGQVTILLTGRSEQRASLIGAGLGGALAGGVILAAGSAMLKRTWIGILTHVGLHIGAALILSVFAVGLLGILETAFDIASPARLHELANTNHPLLKKLMVNAPGTYHHSMMTASLAEGAAEAVGADVPLCRAAAMYHDVGKLRRPGYFAENQSDGRNIHDTLLPEDSAGYILSHVKDADSLLAKYHMPSAIRRVVSEHHGNTLAAYFYYKAKREAESTGEPVSERLFRYPCNRPSTRESAILMISDSCEAAVRSLNEPTWDDVAAMVHKVVQGKLSDGQFDDCPITLSEISVIEKSLLSTFRGLMHERVRYPDRDSGREENK